MATQKRINLMELVLEKLSDTIAETIANSMPDLGTATRSLVSPYVNALNVGVKVDVTALAIALVSLKALALRDGGDPGSLLTLIGLAEEALAA